MATADREARAEEAARGVPDRTPVLVGCGQLLEREEDPARAIDPVAFLKAAAEKAAADAGQKASELSRLDAIFLVAAMGWHPQNGPRLVADALGARPTLEVQGHNGGESPLPMVAEAAARIRSGELDLAFVGGVNQVRTLRRARKQDLKLKWNRGGEGEPSMRGVEKKGSSEREFHYGLMLPTQLYPMFENSLRARRGLDVETHRQRMGRLFSKFTDVAAENPDAWFPVRRSAEELTEVTPTNRMIGFPYPKYLNAVMDTDQACGVLLCSAARARELGIPASRWIYWWGGANSSEDVWFPTERPAIGECRALGRSVRGALERAGTTLDAIDHFDLYSCFPSAVEVACDTLGIDEEDPRGLTVTGGLPYAGGPGNNFCLHSLSAMMNRLREAGTGQGLVTGNGYYLTKHSATVISASPRPEPLPEEIDFSAVTAEPGDEEQPVPFVERSSGTGKVVAYTVNHDRAGAPELGVFVMEQPSGERFLAHIDDRAALEELLPREAIGRTARAEFRDERNYIVLD